jgi:hypothetical protein
LTQREKEMSTCKSCFLLFLSSSRSPRVSNTLLHSFVAIYHRKRAFGKRDFLFMQAVSPCELPLGLLSNPSAALQKTYTLCELQQGTKGKKEGGTAEQKRKKRARTRKGRISTTTVMSGFLLVELLEGAEDVGVQLVEDLHDRLCESRRRKGWLSGQRRMRRQAMRRKGKNAPCPSAGSSNLACWRRW